MNTLTLKIIGSASIFTMLTLTACDKQSPSADTASAPPAAPSPTAQSQAKSAKNYDGPFGLSMGISVAELTTDLGFSPAPDLPTLFKGTPPNPSNLFETYYVTANKHSGLCKIIAITRQIEFNDAGDQIKQEIDSISEALSVKYGKGKLYDYITGAYKNSPEFWAMAAKDDSAIYSYEWLKKQLEPTSPNLVSINVDQKSDYKSGVVRVAYVFNNAVDCEKEAKAKQSNNL